MLMLLLLLPLLRGRLWIVVGRQRLTMPRPGSAVYGPNRDDAYVPFLKQMVGLLVLNAVKSRI